MNLKFLFIIFFIQTIFISVVFGNSSLLISSKQISARVIISNLVHNYDGTPKSVDVRTVPSGLSVRVTYNGSTQLPVDAGKYQVYAEVTNNFWRGSSSAEMTINAIQASITFGNTIFKYDGTRKDISITTSPNSLKTKITYSPNPPINAGSYKVTAEIDEKNYYGTANTDMLIEKVSAEIIFEKTVELYDGSQKSAQIATKPAGLNVTTTYNNSGTPPTQSGKYTLRAVVNETNYTGEKTGTFVINTAPIAQREIFIRDKEDAAPVTIDLDEIFEDPDIDDVLKFSITKNTNEDLFAELTITNNSIEIAYAPDAYGTGEITIRATDLYGAWAESKIIIQLDPVNDAPFIEIDNDVVRFIPYKDQPIPIIKSVIITDPDDDLMTGAQIFFNPRAYERNVDLLLYEDVGNIKGTFSREAGTLNLTGVDSKANYEKAFRRVKYDYRSDKVFTENRILTMYVDDGKLSSNFVHKEIELVDEFIALNIPTAFTPNQDDVNNTWKINNLDLYQDVSISIYNRSGQLIFNSTEHGMEWDGTYNGKPAPVGTYYYVIQIKSYEKVYTGYVTILR